MVFAGRCSPTSAGRRDQRTREDHRTPGSDAGAPLTIQGRTYTLMNVPRVRDQNPSNSRHVSVPEAQLDRFMFHIVIDHRRSRRRSRC